MSTVKQALTEHVITPVLDFIGKTITLCTITVKGLAFLQLVEINQWFTIVISAITVGYMTFKFLNEFNAWLEKRQSKKGKKSK